MWDQTLRHLEEGRYEGLVKKCHGYYQLRHHPAVRWYALYLVWFVALLSLRPAATEDVQAPLPVAVLPIGDHAAVYSSMVSKRVDDVNSFVVETSQRLGRAMQAQHFECLAAVHIGVPIQVLRLANTTLVNPIVTEHGTTLSKAYETSAFYPERAAVLVSRFVPVTLASLDLEGLPREEAFHGTDAHCVLHLLNQFAGRTIYD